MKTVRIREARPTDCAAVCKRALPRFVGVVCEEDGVKIGTGLIIWVKLPGWEKKRAVVTLDISDRMRQMPRLLHRVGVSLVKAGSVVCKDLYVMEDAEEPSANKWLHRLGFRDTGETIGGERLLKWQKP